MATDSGIATEAILVSDTTARGRLRLSPRLMLTLVMVPMVPMVLAMDVLMAMASATPTPIAFTTARGRLRLSPRLRLMLILAMVPMAMLVLAMDIMLMAMLDTPTPTTMESTARGRLMLRPSPTTDLDTAATDMPVPTMATAAMAVDTTGDKSSDHTFP